MSKKKQPAAKAKESKGCEFCAPKENPTLNRPAGNWTCPYCGTKYQTPAKPGMDANEKERLTKAEQTAGLLIGDLRELLTRTDSLPLEEIMVEAIEQVGKLRRRLQRFAEKRI
jgi:ribosomal protein L37AE/L43A